MEYFSTPSWYLGAVLSTAVISWSTYVAYQRYLSRKRVVVELPSSDPSTPFPRIRHAHAKHGLIQNPKTHPSLHTLLDILSFSCSEHGSKPAFGSRRLVKLHLEEKNITKRVGNEDVTVKKTWQFFEKSNYTWITYEQVYQQSVAIGSGLKYFIESGSKFCIYASTCAEWQLMAQACISQSIVLVTAYETLGFDGLLYSLNETEASGIFLSDDLLPNMVSIIKKVPSLKLVVYMGEPNPSILKQLKEEVPKVHLMHFRTLLEMGGKNSLQLTPPQPSDMACIMYTSGSTGPPKGVMLTHANLVSAVGGVASTLIRLLAPNDVYLAFLPLAHVLEFMVEIMCMYAGIAVGYGHPKTLVDTNMRNCSGDILALRPTLMAGVPAVWDAVRKGLLTKLKTRPYWVQALFHVAFHFKVFCYSYHVPLGWIPDLLVFRKIRQQVGGRLRFAISGGAPIADDTQFFLSMVLCPVHQGYGLTESCGICVLFDPALPFTTNNVGVPVPSTEVMLVPTDLYPHEKHVGELWIRGPNITPGYFRQAKLTSDAFQQGWFQTGDVARLLPTGALQIVDRVKNLVKLLNGEYIALEKLESLYSTCLYAQRVCLYADARANWPIVMLVPTPALLTLATSSLGLPTTLDLEQACREKRVVQAVLKDLLAISAKFQMASAETVHGVILCSEEWTPESGMLTAAMKLKRRDIYAKYKQEIDAFYKT